MNRFLVAFVAVALISLTTPLAWAKGNTVKLTVRGETLPFQLEITDAKVISSFSIWNGPGVSVNGKPVHLDPNNLREAFIDWPRGLLSDPPITQDRYVITFHISDGRSQDEYVVVYEFDARGGYIYLPGLCDTDPGFNWSLISHGVEGNWFHSTTSWERLVRPIIEDACAVE